MYICLVTGVFFEPDFVSPWHEITTKKNYKTGILLSVSHGLGETPLLVDVQVKVETGENAGFIFQGTGNTVNLARKLNHKLTKAIVWSQTFHTIGAGIIDTKLIKTYPSYYEGD